jgi:hypothetical protein
MKTLSPATAQPHAAPAMTVNVEGVAELYAAACAFEPDAAAIAGKGDLERLSFMTTAGSLRRLTEALAKVRDAS